MGRRNLFARDARRARCRSILAAVAVVWLAAAALVLVLLGGEWRAQALRDAYTSGVIDGMQRAADQAGARACSRRSAPAAAANAAVVREVRTAAPMADAITGHTSADLGGLATQVPPRLFDRWTPPSNSWTGHVRQGLPPPLRPQRPFRQI